MKASKNALKTALNTRRLNARVKRVKYASPHGETKPMFIFSFFKVPDYEVRAPQQTEANGRAVSRFRRRRSIDHPDVLHYKLHAFGSKLQLRLKRNLNLMSPNLVIERHHRGGMVTTHPAPRNKYYLGKVSSDPDSLVALRSDRILVRPIKAKYWSLLVLNTSYLKTISEAWGVQSTHLTTDLFLPTLCQLKLGLSHWPTELLCDFRVTPFLFSVGVKHYLEILLYTTIAFFIKVT